MLLFDWEFPGLSKLNCVDKFELNDKSVSSQIELLILKRLCYCRIAVCYCCANSECFTSYCWVIDSFRLVGWWGALIACYLRVRVVSASNISTGLWLNFSGGRGEFQVKNER